MRILFVSNGAQKHDGSRSFNSDIKFFNGLIRNGHYVYFFSDRDIAIASSIIRPRGYKKCNERLIKTFRNIEPDVVIFGHVDIIEPDTIEEMRRINPKIRMGQYNVDPLFNTRTEKSIISRAPLMNANFITTGGKVLKRYTKGKSKSYFIPNIVDTSIDTGKSFEDKELPYDLFYARNVAHNTVDQDRETIPSYILKQIPQIKTSFHGFDGFPRITGYTYLKTLQQSKMGLNLSKKEADRGLAKPEEIYLYSSDRIAQYMGNGLLTLIERGYALEDMFKENQEAIYFKSKEELKEKILYYKKNVKERQTIAKAGWLKSHKQYNERVITQYMLDRILGQKLSQNYEWETAEY